MGKDVSISIMPRRLRRRTFRISRAVFVAVPFLVPVPVPLPVPVSFPLPVSGWRPGPPVVLRRPGITWTVGRVVGGVARGVIVRVAVALTLPGSIPGARAGGGGGGTSRPTGPPAVPSGPGLGSSSRPAVFEGVSGSLLWGLFTPSLLLLLPLPLLLCSRHF